MLLVLGLSMLLYGLSADDNQMKENPSVPRRHIALGVSFSERERIDGEKERMRNEAKQRQEAALKKDNRAKTFCKWLEELFTEVRNVR
jgi:hypothetical protein